MKRCIILIDGSNFYHKLKDLELPHLLSFNFSTFIDFLSKQFQLPAIAKARQKGIIVEYVGFSHKPSLALIARSSESKLLSKDELIDFIEQKNPAKAKRRRRRF